jgi:carbon monoxide dehydrogenase subunit G
VAEFTITSETHPTTSTLKAVFEFLTDFKNFKDIMPEDKVENFEFDQNGCSFNIRGVTPLKVKLKDKTPYTKVIFESEGLAKFNFLLEATLTGSAEAPGTCNIQLHGDINPFIKVMAEKPLTQLVNTMALRLSQLQIQNA